VASIAPVRPPVGRGTATDRATAAAPLEELVLDHLYPRRWQIKHLPALHTYLRGAGQIGAAPAAHNRLVAAPVVRIVNQCQRRTRLSARPAAAFTLQ
jgi:hypothetical protein